MCWKRHVWEKKRDPRDKRGRRGGVHGGVYVHDWTQEEKTEPMGKGCLLTEEVVGSVHENLD